MSAENFSGLSAGAPTIPFDLPLSLFQLRQLEAQEEIIGENKIDELPVNKAIAPIAHEFVDDAQDALSSLSVLCPD